MDPLPQMDDKVCALSTSVGSGALAIIRASGAGCLLPLNAIFSTPNAHKQIEWQGHRAYFGSIGEEGSSIDEVLLTTFIAPHSFTGEDSFEISCHASGYIVQQILDLLMRHGFRMARAGEFTQRAFLNGKMDLSQAEAVADLIASESEAAHRVALQQLRGGFAKQLKELRQNFIDFAALIELELDFSEEDVEFADRSQLRTLLLRIETEVERLSSSFSTGQAIKDGIPVCIAGAPNAGKSTLLNALLQEEKALVSQMPGTTRDSIEDVLLIDGLKFRLIDTAGIRSTDDQVEKMGIDRTYQKMEQAALILFLIDLGAAEDVHQQSLKELNEIAPDKIVRVVLNKADAHPEQQARKIFDKWECLSISAKMQNGLTELKSAISSACSAHFSVNEHSLVANARHHGELQSSLEALSAVRVGLDDRLSGELIAQDMRRALEHLGNITGEIASDELLGSIFSRFCIGK